MWRTLFTYVCNGKENNVLGGCIYLWRDYFI